MLKCKRVFQPISNAKSPVVQAVPRGGLLDQLAQVQAGLLRPSEGHFLDLTGMDDFHSAMQTVVRVKQQFAALPSGLRRACMNDPRNLQSLLASAQKGDGVSVALLKQFGVQFVAKAAPKAPEPPLMSDEQMDLVREALRPDPEAQPRKGKKAQAE